MSVIDQKILLEILEAASPEALARWCRNHGYASLAPRPAGTRPVAPEPILAEPGKEWTPFAYVRATAVAYVVGSHMDADFTAAVNFGNLAARLATDNVDLPAPPANHRRALNIVAALAVAVLPAGAVPAGIPKSLIGDEPVKTFTRQALAFLEHYSFHDTHQAVNEMLSALNPDQTARVIMALAGTAEPVRLQPPPSPADEFLTAAQVAEEYDLTRRSVTVAARTGRLQPEEVVQTKFTWMISRAGAKRLWGKRKKPGEKNVQGQNLAKQGD